MKSMTMTAACAAVLVIGGVVSADGLRLKDGRYDGKVTVLRLTPEQVKTLAATRDLVLTSGQRRALQRDAGVAPSQLFIYFTKDGENDCTCMAYDLGLRFAEQDLEVPHEYLVNDEEAARRKRELDEVDGIKPESPR